MLTVLWCVMCKSFVFGVTAAWQPHRSSLVGSSLSIVSSIGLDCTLAIYDAALFKVQVSVFTVSTVISSEEICFRPFHQHYIGGSHRRCSWIHHCSCSCWQHFSPTFSWWNTDYDGYCPTDYTSRHYFYVCHILDSFSALYLLKIHSFFLAHLLSLSKFILVNIL